MAFNFTKEKKEKVDYPRLKEASWYTVLKDNMVRCDLCPNNCILDDGEKGKCLSRGNKSGKLYTYVYGLTAADAIPAGYLHRPLPYHKLRRPWLRVGMVGCGLRCAFCFLGDTVQADPENLHTRYYSPGDVIERARAKNVSTIAFATNEPTNNYEYTLDLAKLAHQNGFKTILSTCGYVNLKPLAELSNYINGACISLKSFLEAGYRKYTKGALQPVLDSILLLNKKKVSLEILYVVIPTETDDMGQISLMAKWVRENLGVYTPVYLMRYYPAFKLKNLPPTPFQTLKEAKSVAEKEGLKYVIILGV